MKKLFAVFAFLILYTFVMHSQVKIVLEKDIKSDKNSPSLVINDSAPIAKNDNLKSPEELEVIINALSYKNKEKNTEKNNRKSAARKPRKS